ncbi:DMT family transporter [Phenylobacterium sp. J367]|uniref:DMT family transporter n=1 Tax=Phenylobacterium sp. J367 TaxID=2898435 RepID=UPI002150B165|nr:DMT family transporter [Phenylobacterium sp. J367]MCR5880967.1 DMT family transporter [Phenylobacterium sp. J367]
MLWVFLAAVAAPLQVARNAMQRGLVGDAGPWGATLVRFLFGLPFSILIFTVVALLTRDAKPDPSLRFWLGAMVGAIAQVAATGFLLMAMRRSGFAVASVLQQSALPLGALLGWVALGDDLAAHAWSGIALATVGLGVLSWPRRDQMEHGLAGGLLGLAAGAGFAVAFNGYRQAGLALDPAHPIFSATAALVVAQVMQSAVLTGLLAATRPEALRAVATSWRSSLAAGFFGSLASACWFAALALSPAGPVRAVGLIETPIAAAVGHRLFRERPSARQWVGGLLTTLGVLMTTLG